MENLYLYKKQHIKSDLAVLMFLSVPLLQSRMTKKLVPPDSVKANLCSFSDFNHCTLKTIYS